MQKNIFSIDYGRAMSGTNGRKQGISRKVLKEMVGHCERKNKEIFFERVAGRAGFYSLPYFEKEARKIVRFSSKLRKDFDTMVVLGMGGSSLGAQAVLGALKDRLPKKGGGVVVLDNVDPDRTSLLLSRLAPERTMVNVISKSGATPETLSQFFLLTRFLKRKVGKRWREHIIVTTDPERGLLRDLVKKYGFLSFPVPPKVGGRFSIFSPVGLIPLGFAGADVNSMLEGARCIDGVSLGAKGEENPVILLSAIYSYFIDEEKKNTFVLFSYSDFFEKFGEWFCQLWGESLGKERRVGRKRENVGQTPVSVRGVSAQHSQLQLYADGPDDKVYTFLGPGKFRKDYSIRPLTRDGDLEFLYNTKLSSLFLAEMEATIGALASRERPIVSILPNERNEFTMGALLFLFECVTVLTGKMIGVNPFDQPGVEEGKRLAKKILAGRRSLGRMSDTGVPGRAEGKDTTSLEVHWEG